jgi:phage-related protein
MLIFILTTLTAIITSLYFIGSNQIKYLKDHWSELRCNPFYMPMASYVGVDTASNMMKCINKGFSDYAGAAMDPLHGQMSIIGDSLGSITQSLSDMRGLFSNVRGGFGMVFQMVFGKLANLMSSMQYLMIRIQTLMGRIVGVFASLIGAMYTGQQLGESIWNGPPGKIVRALS